MAGMKDVARVAGVGLGTVSRVLNGSGYVSEEAKNKVLEAMRALDYTPNYNAQSLKWQRTKVIGVFVPTINHPFFAEVVQNIESLSDTLGYKIMLVCSQNSAEKESSVIRMIVQNRMDGAIFITHHRHEDISPELPIVTLDRHLGKYIPCITSDNYDATFKAVEYLIAHGCKKIGYLGGKPSVESEVSQRLEGYKAAIKRHNLKEYVLFEDIKHGDEGSYASKYIELYGDTDAAFVSGDVLALSLYNQAVSAGRSIPQDFKIVSFDGNLSSWVSEPKFTFVKQNIPALSRIIIEQLIKKINKEEFQEKIIVPSDFIVGETT